MDNRAFPVWLAIAAIVAVGTTSNRSPPAAAGGPSIGSGTEIPRPSAATRDTLTTLADSAARSGYSLLREFLGADWHDPQLRAVDTFELGILIATLPDPYDSHLDWSFDAGMEAIRRGFETSGYVMDRFWLPGRDSIQRTKSKYVPLRELRPGVMLFRHGQADARRLRLLYLVPELPTRGVHKEALQWALAERNELLGERGSVIRPETGPVRIIGPNFSGSALSLKLALGNWLARHPGDTVALVSGSATSPANLRLLDRPTERMRFSATINSDQSLGAVFEEQVLPGLGLKPAQVALLQESSTQYGQGLLAGDSTDDKKSSKGAGTALSDSAERAGPSRERQFVVIPFPMSISSLRTEYQRVPAGKAASPPLPGVPEPARLPLDLEDPTRPQEDLPVTSRLSPVALDLVLDDVARTISRRQVRLVGLLATDVRDKLFLGEEIRKRVRDVQFFTYESNILYLRQDRNRALRGMLVLSTYPLILENQWMTSDAQENRLLAFSSDGAQGVYNATLLQLGNYRALLDYRTGSGDSATARPPVWLSTIGNRTFIPVSRYPSRDSVYVAAGCPPEVSCVQPPLRYPPVRLSFLSLASVILSSIALGWLSARGIVADRQLRSTLATQGITTDFSLRPLKEQVMTGSLKLHDRLYALLLLGAVFGIFLAASTPILQLIERRFGEWIYKVLALLIGPALVVGLLALASGIFSLGRLGRYLQEPGLQYFRYGPFKDGKERWTWRAEVVARTLVALFGAVYLLLSMLFAVDVLQLGRVEFWRFFRRAIEVDSLVSPILPLMLGGIGYAVWCAWHLERIQLLKNQTTFENACETELADPYWSRVSFSSALRDDLRRSGAAVRTIRSRLFQVIPSPSAHYILLAFACLFVWLWPQFGLSFEALLTSRRFGLPSFDWLFRVSVLASVFATAWAAYRLLVVWAGLQECLLGFSRMPIVSAFDRLPPRLARLTRISLPEMTPKVLVGAVADLQWLHLQQIHAATQGEFDKALGQGRATLAGRVADLMREPAAQASALDRSGRKALVARFRSLYDALRELWRLEPMPDDVEALTTGLKKEFDRGTGESAVSTTLRVRHGFAGPVRLWLRAAEEYTASRMVEYIEWVMRHLRVLMLFLLLSMVLTTMLITSYPYQPQSRLRLILLIVLVGVVGILVFVLVQMNRNEVLSRIAHTDPGRITWDMRFLLNVFTFGVVPLLALLSSEFPGLRSALFSWVQPLVGALVKQ